MLAPEENGGGLKPMQIIEATSLSPEQAEAVHKLWNNEYPEKLAHASVSGFEEWLSGLADIKHYLVVDGHGTLAGWGVVFHREGERWFAIILDSQHHKQGLGTTLLDRLREKEDRLSGWVIDHDRDIKPNGERYSSPLGFYLKNGFKPSDTRLETEKISAVKICWER